MRMTSAELAKLCNVSRATVDRVFNNRGRVGEATRRRILEAAEAAGYRPNAVAQSLVTGRTMSVGLVVPGLNNYFFSTLVNAVTRRAQEKGYITLVSMYEDRPEYEARCVRTLLERQVDGVMLFSTEKAGESARLLREQRVPAVALLNEAGGLPLVSIDYRRAMADAVNYAVSLGYADLVFLCPPLARKGEANMHAITERMQGLNDALARHEGVACTVIGTPDYMDRLSAMPFPRKEKTAVLCSSDIYALKVVKLFKTLGVRIPLDVGVMGFDGIDVLDYVEPSVATVDIPIGRLGEAALDYLLDMITDGESGVETTLAHRIRPGQSLV